MIPKSQDNGYLPPGIHVATFDELTERFGQHSDLRRLQTESLKWLVVVARRAGVVRMVVNGSFTTDIAEPNDVDCVLLIDHDFPADRDAEEELLAGFPFLETQIVTAVGFAVLVDNIFATDRAEIPKGMIEAML